MKTSWRPGTERASWGYHTVIGVLRTPRYPQDVSIRIPRTVRSPVYPHFPRTPRHPEDTIGILGIRGVLGIPAVSWGCHRCPGDATGVLRMPAFCNTHPKAGAGARKSLPTLSPRRPVYIVRGAPARPIPPPPVRHVACRGGRVAKCSPRRAACQRFSRSGATRALGAAALRGLTPK